MQQPSIAVVWLLCESEMHSGSPRTYSIDLGTCSNSRQRVGRMLGGPLVHRQTEKLVVARERIRTKWHKATIATDSMLRRQGTAGSMYIRASLCLRRSFACFDGKGSLSYSLSSLLWIPSPVLGGDVRPTPTTQGLRYTVPRALATSH
jgi:hypothetical protein